MVRASVDVQQIHNLVNWREHLEWIEEERAAGRVGMVGVTHWNRDALPDLADASAQRDVSSRCSSRTTRRSASASEELLPIADEQGLAVIVMRPFADGGLLANPPPPEALEPLRRSASRRGRRRSSSGCCPTSAIDVAIPATAKPERTRENAAAGSPPWLGPEEREYVSRLALG